MVVGSDQWLQVGFARVVRAPDGDFSDEVGEDVAVV